MLINNGIMQKNGGIFALRSFISPVITDVNYYQEHKSKLFRIYCARQLKSVNRKPKQLKRCLEQRQNIKKSYFICISDPGFTIFNKWVVRVPKLQFYDSSPGLQKILVHNV